MPMCPVKHLIKNAFIIYHKIIEKKLIIIWKLNIAVKHDFLCSNKKLLIENNIRLSSNKN